MTHILELISRAAEEKAVAKAKIQQLPIEVAQIVYYFHGSEVAHMVRYANMALAKKQFEELIKARKQNKEYLLTGASGTAYIPSAASICALALVDIEVNLFLMAEQQKRFNARMQGG